MQNRIFISASLPLFVLDSLVSRLESVVTVVESAGDCQASEHKESVSVSCLRNSFKNSKLCQPLKLNSNPPSSPFFKGGIFLRGISNPSLTKRGKGRFLDGMTLELCNELLRHYTHREPVLAAL